MLESILNIKDRLGEQLVILTHHYQRKEIIDLGDFRGDSFALSQKAATHEMARYIVFCGVHFMAESAAVLAQPHQTVQIPMVEAGCWMADMADISIVHTRFRVDHIRRMRERFAHIKIVVHPECTEKVVAGSDAVGSTSFIVKYVTEAPSGSTIGIGTEINLIERLALDFPDKTIVALSHFLCPNCIRLTWRMC